jgi:tetratricopeptide (TPR) repeat protein
LGKCCNGKIESKSNSYFIILKKSVKSRRISYQFLEKKADEMTPAALILLIGMLYTLFFGGLSLLRREGLSTRFAIEALLLTLITALLTTLTNFYVHPVLFLIVIYIFTMRVRLLIDFGTFFASQRRFELADRIYKLGWRLGTDSANQIALRLNQAILLLQRGQIDQAIADLQSILEQKNELGFKHEAACHYNLGVAWQRQGQTHRALQEFEAVIECWPASEFARRAATVIENSRHPPSA